MSDLDEEYQLDYFHEEGFERKECPSCGAHFWTRDSERDICGEPPCADYDFIGDPGFDTEYSLEEMREAFLSFFEDHDHERIEPYPVAANRWRDDVLLTQASIYDFQPLVTSGETPPPANPLTISQPCIRMQDIDNVGKTGRHTMAFEMMAHHAFNAREDIDDPDQYAYEGEVYWKSETVAYCDQLLDELGADIEDVTYIEDPWVGGGNAGPAIEVIYRGLELATLVFMCMEQDPDGDYELKDGNRYSYMDTYVVDTGYGLERWTWMSQGTPTVYEAVYPEMISFLKDNAGLDYSDREESLVNRAARLSGKLDIDDVDDVEAARDDIADELGVETDELRALVEPLEDIYAIADHCRTLAYMLGDGIVPSNVGTGYLARMVLRRTKRLADGVGVDAPLDELVDMQAERLDYENRDTVRDIVRTEVEKYRETLERGRRHVERLAEEYAQKGDPIPLDEVIELYDSRGIQPETVEEIAADHGADVEIPDDFYSLVAERHGEADADADDGTLAGDDDRIADLPETEKLYYEEPERTDFEAVVLDVIERDADGETVYDVALDQTMFYPEGGGQPADTGTLSTDDVAAEVTDVQETNGVVLHRTDEAPGKGEFVRGQIDGVRRRRLMQHHTATHIVGHAARQVLGDHVRQAGAQKGVESARFDIRHYERISREEVKRIERVANNIVTDNLPVKQEWPKRNEAEADYGFDIYQGGIPPGETLRLIQVGEDVQACAGTHVLQTGDIGTIKILSTERVQDGVERLVFAAGDAAIEATQRTEDALYDTAEVLDVSPQEVPATAERFFEEWKDRGKRIEELKEQLAEARAHGGDGGEEVDLGGTTAVVQRVDGDMDDLRATANALVEDGTVAVLGSGDDSATFVVAVPDNVDINAGAVVGELADRVGGGGGGPPDFAQGGGPDVDSLDEALDAAPEILRSMLEA
ncbi:alanine--tRNA ligase [Natronomonas pharaonis DSM 2160]|uniref:Alanine--tRNA ligase n=1 Tax=Natronomonas pharaonis (strain ATCC 35678 / DSM 2160 / CIP 103997 / JCM 8858 / NBRC 14720 / NCIMB 2260 / Gabara) TaxID=348780 RepID=SYA_NATPD|nr:alanine--tRNA ligase [Natronomonas pharaonis]Q3ITT7.1 RecName: Full=Alanine--tRNA ligase; AltName: Full=Alanyl-tRNA synthetase; Short=AlaRS [Natronomonas pharaonis DSM 2160]CAI48446.1 alanine--tRNA ligase [Natronomonas pharaonis DSM 2160]